MNRTKLKKIEAGRIVSGTNKLVSIALLYEELGWEELRSRRLKQKLGLFHKIQNGLCPGYLYQLVSNLVSYRSLYNLRNAQDLLTIAAGTQLFPNSFFPSVVRQWNNLTASTRNSPSVETFKQSLNTYVYDKPTFYYTGNWIEQVYHTQMHTNCSPWIITCATRILVKTCCAVVVKLKQNCICF